MSIADFNKLAPLLDSEQMYMQGATDPQKSKSEKRIETMKKKNSKITTINKNDHNEVYKLVETEEFLWGNNPTGLQNKPHVASSGVKQTITVLQFLFFLTIGVSQFTVYRPSMCQD